MEFRNAPKIILFSLLFVVYALVFFTLPAFSQDVGDLESEVEKKNQEIKEKESTLDKIKREIEEINKSSVSIDEKIELMSAQVDKIDTYIKSASNEIKQKEKVINQKQSELEKEQKALDDIASNLYKSSRFGFIEYLFANRSADDLLRGLFLRKLSGFGYVGKLKLLSQNFAQLKQEKLEVEREKGSLEEEKEGLEKSKESLISQKVALASQAASKKSLSSRLGSDISSLKGEISKLQEAILLAKASGGIIGVGDVPGSVENLSSKTGFVSNAKSGSFAVFSLGAYTHRNGMSQYGAYGRAKAGQSAEQILKAYYGTETLNKSYAVPSLIYVNGTNEYGQAFNCQAFTVDEYLKRLYEVPSSWPTAVLRAQVVSARSYALRYIQTHSAKCNGHVYICPSQSCQVVKKEKNASAWQQAVDYTSKWVLSGGTGNFQFSSTSGGYLNTSGWDTTNKQGGSGSWTENAYEGSKYGNSPWFYKTWYNLLNGGVCNSSKKDVTNIDNKGRNYLSNKEMADIINVWLVNEGSGLKGSVDYSRILPVTISDCPISGIAGNPYNKDQMAGLLNNPVKEVYSVVSSFSSQGQTSSILFSTNRGTITIPGASFEAVYNLRAPGYLQIPPQGNNVTFINIEKK